MHRFKNSFFLAAFAAALLRCGGTVTSSQTGSTTSGSGGSTTGSSTHAASSSSAASTTTTSSSSSSSSSSSGTGGGTPTGCPAQPPTIGTPCNVPGSVTDPPCTYGTEPLPECRQAFACADGAWAPGVGWWGSCPSMAACPSSAPVDGSDCSMTTTPECAYPDGTLCSCGTFAGPKWTCFAPMGACPTVVPNVGSACTAEGTSCMYEGCKLHALCTSGVWKWLQVAC
jgi:hypothetical protein